MQKIIDFIKQTFHTNTNEFTPLHEPKFMGNEKKYLNECIDSTFVSSVGKFVDTFEQEFAKKVGSKYAIATVNGTAALHVALLLAGVNKGDEVITQPLSFIATGNAIAYVGAKPIFVDVDRSTMGLSPEALEKFLNTHCRLIDQQCINQSTRKVIKVCLPMHTFGHPCKIDAIQALCEKWKITLIEDAAESLGSYYKKQHTGTFGEMGTFSFNGNKIITSGGGGVLVTNNALLAQKAKHLTTTAKVPHPYEYVHDSIGYNYRLPNLNAALLVAQLEQLNVFLKSKKDLATIYKDFFTSIHNIEFVEEPENADSNYWLQTIKFETKKERDAFLEFSNAKKVMTRPIWRLLNELEMFKHCQCDALHNANYLEQRVVNIPSSVRI